ncbi:MAG: hypothetical protein FJ147_00375 [Deltaproteobacteria bacterium]|nr:hypothetical protein [Deltaproteobacteria bacterium]
MAQQVQRVPKEEQAELKRRIRMLKAKRDEAISQKDSKKVSSLRRGIRTLKRRTRVVAQAVKAEAATAKAAADATAAQAAPAQAAPAAAPQEAAS